MNTQIIILAAGHGKRMQSELPKALTPFAGKTFIHHILSTVADSMVCEKPIIVVGPKREQIIKALGTNYNYVTQEEQLGTGYAVMIAEEESKKISPADTVIVLYGDHPLISAETIKKLVKTHRELLATITMATSVVSDFHEWRSAFLSFGRIIRDSSSEIIKIVEYKDANEEEKNITEIRHTCVLRRHGCGITYINSKIKMLRLSTILLI
jgi:bifunctional UDP-N-acetylglucosamine pyrophosphorylase/glucosamine-1-phosphate N-acetyltransferase